MYVKVSCGSNSLPQGRFNAEASPPQHSARQPTVTFCSLLGYNTLTLDTFFCLA